MEVAGLPAAQATSLARSVQGAPQAARAAARATVRPRGMPAAFRPLGPGAPTVGGGPGLMLDLDSNASVFKTPDHTASSY